MTKREFDLSTKNNFGRDYYDAIKIGVWSHLTTQQKNNFKKSKDFYYEEVKEFERYTRARAVYPEPSEKNYVLRYKEFFSERLKEAFKFRPAEGGIHIEVGTETFFEITKNYSEKFHRRYTAYRHDLSAKICLSEIKNYWYGEGFIFVEKNDTENNYFGTVFYKARGYDIKSAPAKRDDFLLKFTDWEGRKKSLGIYKYHFFRDSPDIIISKNWYLDKIYFELQLKDGTRVGEHKFWHKNFNDRREITLSELDAALIAQCSMSTKKRINKYFFDQKIR